MLDWIIDWLSPVWSDCNLSKRGTNQSLSELIFPKGIVERELWVQMLIWRFFWELKAYRESGNTNSSWMYQGKHRKYIYDIIHISYCVLKHWNGMNIVWIRFWAPTALQKVSTLRKGVKSPKAFISFTSRWMNPIYRYTHTQTQHIYIYILT